MFGSQCSVFDSSRAAAKSHLTPHNTPEGGGGGGGDTGPDNTGPFLPSTQPLEPQQSQLCDDITA